MSWTYEVALRGEPGSMAAVQNWLANGPRAAWSTLPGLTSFDVYTNDDQPSHDPFNHDGPGPLMMLMLEFATIDALRRAIGSGAIAAEVARLPAGIASTGAAFERILYPVGEGSEPAPLAAPFSYVVRYHLPADDPAAFVANYIATHPSTQAKLPEIRAILCYLPLDGLDEPALPSANYLVGNEVVFDDIDAFNRAMLSPVRQELRTHFRAFPRFSGANTHYPMRRVRLVG
jgi:hypothetical protein